MGYFVFKQNWTLMYIVVHFPGPAARVAGSIRATMPNYFFSLPRLISRTFMAEETEQPQQTNDSEPTPAPQSQQSPAPQHQPGQRRNDRRDRGRHPGGRRDHFRSDHPPQPAAQETPAEPSEKETDIDDEEETEHDRSSSRQRHHRGGRPPKRIIEEWANDIYCE
jgi:hypothetical protein